MNKNQTVFTSVLLIWLVMAAIFIISYSILFYFGTPSFNLGELLIIVVLPFIASKILKKVLDLPMQYEKAKRVSTVLMLTIILMMIVLIVIYIVRLDEPSRYKLLVESRIFFAIVTAVYFCVVYFLGRIFIMIFLSNKK